MKEWIVIVDMDQPGSRKPVALADSNEFSCAAFESVDAIRELRSKHVLGVFEWWAFNYETGESEVLYK